ncbi:MAG: fibronectin type III domain-containing protein [Chitinophagaceae bacterium]|nr:fibronectin type III domain-containing protein [Oligoflexus sp.]
MNLDVLGLIGRRLFLSLLGLSFLSGCTKLGLQSATKVQTEFLGIQTIVKNPDNSYYLSWQIPEGTDSEKLSYRVFSSVQKPTANSTVTTASTAATGKLMAVPDENAPVKKGSLLATVTNENSFTIPTQLQPGVLYSFQVRSVDDQGRNDSNQQVLFLELADPVRINFSGLLAKNVKLANDRSMISLSWDAASNTTGTVSYAVYGDTIFANPLASISETQWNFQAPELGKSYTFAVRAKDSLGFDTNSEFVIVDVPDPRDHTPPTFVGLKSVEAVSQKKLVLHWDASPSADVARYMVYDAFNLSVPLGSTSDTSFALNNLTSATSYSFVVHAKDASGNEDQNAVVKAGQTLGYTVPDFAGIDSVTSPTGTAALTSLRVNWQPGGGTITGYRVFMRTGSNSFDWSSPLVTLTDPLASFTLVNGLTQGTAYTFAVRAYDMSSGTYRPELNTKEITAATVTIKPPTFAGAISAAAGEGTLGLSSITVGWVNPQSDGVYDGFRVSYEEGTCAASFSNAPLTSTVSDPALRAFAVTGLTSNRHYRFKVQATYAPSSLSDNNSNCVETTTIPLSPTFSGISAVELPSGIQGFDSLNIFWPRAAGSFSYYKIEWSTSATFAVIGGTSQIIDRETLNSTVTGLPTATTIYIRVSAVFDQAGILLTSGLSRSLSGVTQPNAPRGEGVSSVTVAAADALNVVWTAPTNAGSLYNGYKLWYSCSANAASSLSTKLSGPADHTYAFAQLGDTLNGLTQNVNCCVQVRAYFSDGTHNMESTSSQAMVCNTPTLAAPAFAGIKTLSVPTATIGFSQLTVGWDPVIVAESGLFSYYQIAYATTANGQDWSTATQVATRSQISTTLSGLTPNTTYYVRARAVNANGSPVATRGDTAVLSATTTPVSPSGDALTAAVSSGSTKIQISYVLPSATTGGLFNQVFLFVQSGTLSDVSTYRTSVEAGGVLSSEIATTVSSKQATLASLPALIAVPLTELDPASAVNNLQILGLPSNQQVCVQALAVHWINGQPEKYLKSTTASSKCATPTAGAPIFAGASALSGFNDVRDFTQLKIDWPAITGDCTAVEISVTNAANTPNFSTPFATATCTDTTKTLVGLVPHSNYYVQVRAVNTVSGSSYYAGQGVEFTKKTEPRLPAGDLTSTAVATSIAKAEDKIDIVYSEATSGFWNKTYIWKGTGNTQSAADAAVRALALTKSDFSGPTGAPFAINNSGMTTYSDVHATSGVFACYLARSVYTDASYYNPSANDVVKCAKPDYTTPSFGGVASGTIVGTWSDGTAKIQLNFNGIPSGSIEEYMVYFSPNNTLASFGDLTAEPWQRVTVGDTTYDNNAYDNTILVGGLGQTVAGKGYYLVRYKFYNGLDTDTNVVISSLVTVPDDQGNYAYVPPSFSGLSYGYYMAQYQMTSSNTVTPVVTTNETSLAICNTKFHQNKVSIDASCGTGFTSILGAKSLRNSTPTAYISWHNAWGSCRASSSSGMLVRLPTDEESDRALKWTLSSYQGLLDLTTTNPNTSSTNCLTYAGGVVASGTHSLCKNSLAIYDGSGNLEHWVDSRLLRYDVNAAGESRFSYGPVIGRTMSNGIDNRVSRRHTIDPGSSGLALLKGISWYGAPQRALGADAETWKYATIIDGINGYRCASFLATTMPTMTQLSLPNEPVYDATDIPAGQPQNWKIPENLYVKDTRPEDITLTVNGNTADAIAEGKVTIAWKPWSKTVCDVAGTCTSSTLGMSYQIYRFIEPTLVGNYATEIPWAISGGAGNPYASDKPLDPLAVDASGNPLFTSSTTDGKLIATVSNCDASNLANCTFDDSTTASTGFSPNKLYDYLMVAVDSSGNRITSKRQRYRSPYFVGGQAVSGAAPFRTEPRYRRAGVFLVDDAYQAAQTRPQTMVYVPLDKSGLDHDFFVQKYEASQYNGTVSNNTPAGASDWPLQSDISAWTNNAAVCDHKFKQTGSFDLTGCGNGTAVNATTATVQSKSAMAPLISIDQGSAWKSCRNTGISDPSGANYYLKLLSDSEWSKAADWGDMDQDGVVDQSVYGGNVGVTISSLEWDGVTADSSTVRCHTDNNPTSAYPADDPATAKCRTRYGAADMVGNVAEWTTGQQYSGAGRDNGTDGLWYGMTLPTANGGISSLKEDLLRGFPTSSALSVIAANSDQYYYASTLRGSFRGGSWSNGSAAGRWRLDVLNAPSSVSTYIGLRCGL